MSDPTPQQRQNFAETIALMRDIASHCPATTEALTRLADSSARALSKGRLRVEDPGTGGVLEAGELAKTHIESTVFPPNRFSCTTFATHHFPGRNLDRRHCPDMTALFHFLATMTHETFHRFCHVDPDVYDMNLTLLNAIRQCTWTDTPCGPEIIAAVDAEIQAETAARTPGPGGSEGLKSALLAGGIGVLAAALAFKFGLAAALVGGAKAGGLLGSVGGPGGALVGIGLGVIAAGIAFGLYNPCEGR